MCQKLWKLDDSRQKKLLQKLSGLLFLAHPVSSIFDDETEIVLMLYDGTNTIQVQSGGYFLTPQDKQIKLGRGGLRNELRGNWTPQPHGNSDTAESL